MKKSRIAVVLLLGIMLVSGFAYGDTDLTSTSSPNAMPILKGDVNGDGVIDSADLQLIAQHIVNTTTLSGDDFLAADVNASGTVDSADLQLVAQYLVGTIVEFPTPTPTPLPIITMSCVQARDAIQDALIDYNAVYGEWPTADGQPGDIEWTELVPEFMAGIPSIDSSCNWWVNSDPEGGVCVRHEC